jgi:hypothetical protein
MMSKVIRSGTSLSISILFVIIASAAIVHGRQPLCEGLETRHLFKIERNKNANIVQYDVQVTPDGKLYQKEPVIAYWIRVAEDGRERELTSFQRKWYYGFKTKYDVGSNSAIVEMDRSVREIKVYEVEGVYRGEIQIDGQPAFLEKIFVASIKSWLYRKVTSIELYGKDTKTGVDCYEMIKP